MCCHWAVSLYRIHWILRHVLGLCSNMCCHWAVSLYRIHWILRHVLGLCSNMCCHWAVSLYRIHWILRHVLGLCSNMCCHLAVSLYRIHWILRHVLGLCSNMCCHLAVSLYRIYWILRHVLGLCSNMCCHLAVSLCNTPWCWQQALLWLLPDLTPGEPHPRDQLLQLSGGLLLRAGGSQHRLSSGLLLPWGHWLGLEGLSTGDVQRHHRPLWGDPVQPLWCREILRWGAPHCCVWWDWSVWCL